MNLRSRMLALGGGIAIMSTGLGSAASGDVDAKVIKIAVVLPFSGTSSTTVTRMDEAVRLAVEEANRAGLPNGYRLEVDDLDHGAPGKPFDAKLAGQNADAAIADPQVMAIYGPMHTDSAKEMIPKLNAASLASLVSTVTTPSLTKGAPGAALRGANPDRVAFFRVNATNDNQGPAGAQFTRQLGIKNVYVLDDHNTYGETLANLFEIAFGSAGGTVLAHDHTAINQPSYAAELGKIRALHPDAVYFGATGKQLADFRVAMGKAGLTNVPMISGNAMGESTYATVAGPYAPNSYFTLVTPDEAHVPSVMAQDFASHFRRRWKTDTDPFDIASYACAQIEIGAIRNAIRDGNGAYPTRELVRSEIAGMSRYPTAIGKVTFDHNGDLRNPYISFYTYGYVKTSGTNQVQLSAKFVNQVVVNTISTF